MLGSLRLFSNKLLIRYNYLLKAGNTDYVISVFLPRVHYRVPAKIFSSVVLDAIDVVVPRLSQGKFPAVYSRGN